MLKLVEIEGLPKFNYLLPQIDPKPCTPRGMQPEKTRAKDGWVSTVMQVMKLHLRPL